MSSSTQKCLFSSFRSLEVNGQTTSLKSENVSPFINNIWLPLGGIWIWTRDLLICSQMLYHWAIPPPPHRRQQSFQFAPVPIILSVLHRAETLFLTSASYPVQVETNQTAAVRPEQRLKCDMTYNLQDLVHRGQCRVHSLFDLWIITQTSSPCSCVHLIKHLIHLQDKLQTNKPAFPRLCYSVKCFDYFRWQEHF